MIGCSSYSFGHYFDDNGGEWCIKKAKELGFEGIEFSGLGVAEDDYEGQVATAKKFKAYADEIDFTITHYSTGADMTNYRCGGKCIEDEIERLKKQVDIAEILGVKTMRHDIAWDYNGGRGLKNFMEALPIYANACREITKYAEQKGIATMFENHGFFVQAADRVITLIEEVNHPNFGLLLDMGNFICADDNNLNSCKICAKYAKHVHAKDFFSKPYWEADAEGYFRTNGGLQIQGCALGEGIVNPVACIEILKREGYKGNYSLEYEGNGDNIEGIIKGLEVMKANI